MAGAPTKYGFSGGEAPEGTSHPRSFPTLLGHDTHDASAAGSGEVLPTPRPDPVAPAEQAQSEPQQDPTLRPPTHSGKSNYPTVARLFGRWNQEGQLVASEATAPTPAPTGPAGETSSTLDEDSLFIPRQGIPRWVLAAIAAAVVFAVVAFLLGGRERPPARPAAPPSSSLQPLPAPVVPGPPQQAPPPAPARPRRTAVLATTRGGPNRERSDASRRRPRPRPSALSDDALPPSF
jgi:hypothetical protein